MPNEWHTPLEVPGNRLPETGSRRKLLNVRGACLKARSVDAKIGRATEEAKTKIELTLVICRELSDLGGTQRQQNLKERSCTEAAPNEETQNGAEKTSAEKRTSAEILGRGRKGNSIRPAIGSE
ncbi:hypothetical protein V6N12_046364 [Hibiscus sabdariffa]|uniref:Uncharacterized protein n=1 Tax=Hibiscus sabdariffa TaxID=183260 RepID=A0ABR2DIE9_9ROSI